MSNSLLAVMILLALAGGSLKLASAQTVVQSSARPTRLRCEYLNDPTGIDVAAPRLSWIMDSSAQADRQTAYQVIVASSPEKLADNQGDIWDSGRVATDQSINVEYAGKPLLSRMHRYWKVRIWDKDNNVTPWSEPAEWSTGLLAPADWKGAWIGLSPSINDDDFTVANLDGTKWIWGGEGSRVEPGTLDFTRTFELPSDPITSAGIVLYGEDAFTLFVNGHTVAHADRKDRPTAVDLKQFLNSGWNHVDIEVQNKKAKPQRGGLAARVVVNGRTVTSTDENWKVSSKGWVNATTEPSAWQNARITGDFLVSDQGRQWLWHPAAAPAHYLRHEFTADKSVARATAYVSGLGWFELHVNGRKVGDHVLDPIVSDYSKRAYYVTFDVTNLIKQGPNAVGAILGLGRYCAMQLRLQIEIDYSDGTTALWTSDGSWKGTDHGPIISQSEYDGETYDAQKEIAGWDEAGFDDSSWLPVAEDSGKTIEMSAQMAEPIRVTGIVKPIAVTNPRPGVFVFDMGQNMVGWCQLRVSGPAGTTVRLHHAETLRPDGMIYADNLRTAEATDRYTLKGGGEEIYEPRFTYHGFRFVEVTGFPGTPPLDALEGQVVNDDLADSAAFECSNPLLNQIHHNIYWGVRGNYNGVPTDCPQRNERLGWLGDRGEECAGEAYCFDIAALYQKWVRDMRDSQTEAGSIADTAPPGTLHNDGVVWPSTYPLAVDMLFNNYANIRCVAEQYDAMKKWIVYMNGSLKNGIMQKNTYGDWCVPPESAELVHSKDPLRQTDGKLLSTAYFFHDLKLLSKAADLLGKPNDVRQFDAQAETIKTAFNREFLDSSTGQYGNGAQTASVLPLAFGMVPDDARKKVFDTLVKKIQSQNKDHLGTGLVGAQWLMRVLSDNGRPDLAYAIATQTSYPSWGYMVSKGATTIWELWNGDTADPSMNSGNHVMLIGDLNIWLHEYALGIAPDPDSPGWKHFIIHPRLTAQLDWARGFYDSPYGRIECDWKRSGNDFVLNVTVPPNSTASVYTPGNAVQTGAGEVLQISGGEMVHEMPSGSFQFVSHDGK
jgi:alpha-L-rhamnosidase